MFAQGGFKASGWADAPGEKERALEFFFPVSQVLRGRRQWPAVKSKGVNIGDNNGTDA